jgi:solute:Na+ symporter, SSS family
MAANVSGFNTVFTYDIWRAYIARGRPDAHYVSVGRWVTVIGVIGGIGTAFIAAAYSNIMNYMQSLFSFFNAPLFATFIVGLFWKRMTPWAGFWGLLLGTLAAMTSYVLYKAGVLAFGTDLNASFWGAGIAFVVDVLVSVAVTLRTTPKPESELAGLVHGVRPADVRDDSLAGDRAWYRSPLLLGVAALILGIALYLPLI